MYFMPQMSSMNWIMLMIFILLNYLILMLFIYFNFNNFMLNKFMFSYNNEFNYFKMFWF